MDMVCHLQRLFAYDAWANREVLNAIRSSLPTPPICLKRLGHILSAELLWLERLHGQQPSVAVWPEWTVGRCETQATSLESSWKKYLAGANEPELATLVPYRNSKGEDWSSRKDDILLHVATHSTYHRGQIVADLRAAGFTPPYTDFIHAVRQGLVK